MKVVSRGWRALRTGIAFVIFGVGALALGAIALPIISRRTFNHASELRMQWLIHRAFRLFVWMLRRLGLVRVTWRGREALAFGQGQLIVANHPTLLDVVLLVAALPQADCVVKKAAWRNPYLRRIVAAAGYIANQGGPSLADACVDRLRSGRRLLLFPEGTRSPRVTVGTFHRGAARIALASGCAIVPVVIRCEPPVLGKGERWFRVPDRAAHMTLEVQAPVSPVPYGDGDARARAARDLTRDLHQIFEREVRHANA